MVDSNIYREKILPSEKAFAYKMKMDALKHQGKRTCGTQYHKSRDILANKSPDGSRQIQNYVRLTNLIPDLLKLVDNSVLHDKRTYLTIGIKPAVELSYLTKNEQNLLYSTFIYDDLTPSHGQAIKIRKLSKDKQLNYNALSEVLSQTKGNQKEQISIIPTDKTKVTPIIKITFIFLLLSL